MLMFVFEDVLFRFQFQGPALELLFQLPPTMDARAPSSPKSIPGAGRPRPRYAGISRRRDPMPMSVYEDA